LSVISVPGVGLFLKNRIISFSILESATNDIVLTIRLASGLPKPIFLVKGFQFFLSQGHKIFFPKGFPEILTIGSAIF